MIGKNENSTFILTPDQAQMILEMNGRTFENTQDYELSEMLDRVIDNAYADYCDNKKK